MSISEVLRKAFFYDKWDIGVYYGSVESFMGSDSLSKVKWVQKHNKYSFVADPFIVQEDGSLRIMGEYFNYFSSKGKIVELADSYTKTIIEENYHLSYPHMFEYEGEKYCVPEGSVAGDIKLYKYNNSKFVYQKPLISNFAGVDNTLLYYNNKWWMFCTKSSAANSDLYIFHSDSPISGWQPHKKNPVKIDVASARPAGDFFIMNGELYRPSQNCSKTYGGSLVINKVTRLDEDVFSEELVSEIMPDKSSQYPDGIHTISIGKKVIVVDGKRLEFSLLNPLFI
ncbi:MAG: hypothetical protein K0R98_426, partial [Rickettsiaceae bacterium]|nr:hypothetical protein [Rickettsiaceae bacterium]